MFFEIVVSFVSFFLSSSNDLVSTLSVPSSEVIHSAIDLDKLWRGLHLKEIFQTVHLPKTNIEI